MNIIGQDETLQEIDTSVAAIPMTVRKKKKVKLSKHGIQYPSLPAGVVKKLATTYARTGGNSKAKVSKDTLDAIMQATDWFFEQVSDDLGAYAKHAGRKTIDESDVVTLMKRYVLPMTHRKYLSYVIELLFSTNIYTSARTVKSLSSSIYKSNLHI